ncbi:Hypothetical protein R9X50_00230700 [Acrodontium crateriforme]|uniref:HMA domain-containing protein n=1 Tax=Acrodontium crateriforme TaxID=150365 RepID=A0AAQ3M193_9PEZI|nr:Hypothetical protein R9X50_00230700 [Acrodontium crateriforme]
MACQGGCCGSVKLSPPSLQTVSVENTPARNDETDGLRCCPDSDVDANECCDESCIRSLALAECIQMHDAAADVAALERDDFGCSGTGDSMARGKEPVLKQAGGCCAEKRPSCSVEVSCSATPCGDAEACKTDKPAKQCCPSPCGGTSTETTEKQSSDLDATPLREGCCSQKATKNADVTELEPCPSHLEAVRRRYSNAFGKLTCMCKALLAQGLQSCCSTKRKLSPERIRNASSSRNRSQKSSIKGAGSGNSSSCQSKLGSSCEKDCNALKEVDTSAKLENKVRMGGKSNIDHPQSNQNRGLTKPGMETSFNEGMTDLSDTRNAALDLERADGALTHVALSVQGMTCTGCETKLLRSIQAIASATNIQASIVLSRAEFDIISSVTAVEQAIAQLERATGFVLTELSTTGNELHVRLTTESHRILDSNPPLGVLDIKRYDKETIAISYDAHVIRARDLLEHSFGIQLELAPIRPPANIATGAKHVRYLCYMTFFSATMTIPVLIFAWAPLPPNEVAYQSASLALATAVQIIVAGPFYKSALRSLIFSRVIEMDLLIVLSTTAAYIFSVVAYAYMMVGRRLSTGEFFESSTLLVTLIMIGRLVSAFARQKAIESISMSSLQITTATLVDDEGHIAKEIDSRSLHYDDIFLVQPESRIVTDGTVHYGISEVDESMITGETKPIAKTTGSSVFAGSINGAGPLHVRVARLPGENTISSITDMVDRAKLSKPKVQELADRVAGYFVPVVVAITTIVFCAWIAIGLSIRHQSGSVAAPNALTYAIAVLIVSCPCAVGLAVPMVIVIACGVGAQHGVVFQSAQSIENCWRATHLVFDKTGTLTLGKAKVVDHEFLVNFEDGCLSMLLALVEGNKHPNSVALAKHLVEQGLHTTKLDSMKTVVGKGIEGTHGSRALQAGSANWLALDDHPTVQTFHSNGLTTLCFAIDNIPQAIFGLADTLRPEAKSVVSNFISRGVDVSIISGDDAGVVESIGSQLGLNASKLKARCTPQDKQEYIEALTQNKNNIVIFCGDGTNDAGALAQATIGVHMSEGTDVARSASDVVLMRPDISGLLFLMDVSRAAYFRIVVNFCWAAVYNLFAILLAAGAFVNVRIPPQYAGLGELVSVLPVILISLQMKWMKI